MIYICMGCYNILRCKKGVATQCPFCGEGLDTTKTVDFLKKAWSESLIEHLEDSCDKNFRQTRREKDEIGTAFNRKVKANLKRLTRLLKDKEEK